MCIHFLNPTQREQIADEVVCNMPLPYSSPERTATKIKRLHDMSHADDFNIRVSAAGNPMLDINDMKELSHDNVFQVRAWVIRNPACPEWLAYDMSVHDNSAAIRAAARYKLNMFG